MRQKSSTPPSADPNRKKKSKKGTGKKPGGQPGRVGITLKKTDTPDEIQTIKLDKRTLAKGKTYKQKWAKKMQKLLLEINEIVKEAGGVLNETEAENLKIRYRKIVKEGERESPLPEPPPEGVPKKRGRIKKTDARNLLERLRDFEDETLRFMTVREVPFTNNLGERDIRMTKVQQKISGCFRSWDGAETFCRIRSYINLQ